MASDFEYVNRHKLQLNRRDLFRVAGVFGLTSTLLGLSDLVFRHAPVSAETLASAAYSTKANRDKKNARYTLRFGASHFTKEGLKILPNGSLQFVQDLEARTGGEIRVEYIGGNKLCRELACTKMCMTNEIDFFSASTQNASTAAPYFNVLDFAYLWPSRTAQYYFFYQPESEQLFREPLRKFHNLQFLFTHCELRGFMMGRKYANRPKMMRLEDLQGAKLRVTGSQLGRIGMRLLGTEPVPVAWTDTIKALRIGLLDGAETWSSAVPYGGWGPVISQDVHCRLFSGNAMTAMNLKRFENLEGRLQDAVLESAYLAQVDVQKTSEAKLLTITGITDPPLPGSYYYEHGIRNCIWGDEELQKAERKASPKYNPEPWKKWRARLNRMAGGADIFEELHKCARQVSSNVSPLDVTPHRWW